MHSHQCEPMKPAMEKSQFHTVVEVAWFHSTHTWQLTATGLRTTYAVSVPITYCPFCGQKLEDPHA